MMKGMFILMIVMFISILIAGAWDSIPLIKNSVNAVLNPTFGSVIQWNYLWGLIIIVFFINLALTLLHKYTTNQEALKALKEEQKQMREQMKALKDQPDKMMELQKKQMPNVMKSFELSMKPLVYTAIPFILFLRWFGDFFKELGDPKIFFGFFGWLGTYLIFSIIFSIILRKTLKVH